MPLPLLCARLEHAHRVMLRNQLARLDDLARDLVDQEKRPASPIARIEVAFAAFRTGLTRHLLAEEASVFARFRARGGEAHRRPVRPTPAMRRALQRMTHDHHHTEEQLDDLVLAVEAGLRAFPGSRPLRLLHAAVRRMELLMHEQIFLENQILFRRALGAGW